MADELEPTPTEPEKKEDRRKRDPEIQAFQRIIWELEDMPEATRVWTVNYLKARYAP